VLVLANLDEDARAAAADLLAQTDPPTAIFAASDHQAIGVLEAAGMAGVPVPEDLSVIGFDNVEAAGFAGLTTIAQPLQESGALGAELLLRRMTGKPVQGRRMQLALVERGSTAPPGVARVRGRGTTTTAHAGHGTNGGGLHR